MTRNYDEVTHSTASEERLINHARGSKGGQGFEPDALKYMWPGVVAQTVDLRSTARISPIQRTPTKNTPCTRSKRP